jgi:hypothetical protein
LQAGLQLLIATLEKDKNGWAAGQIKPLKHF